MSDAAVKPNAWTDEAKVSPDHTPDPCGRGLTTSTERASPAHHRAVEARGQVYQLVRD
jgi:hypothetical protein